MSRIEIVVSLSVWRFRIFESGQKTAFRPLARYDRTPSVTEVLDFSLRDVAPGEDCRLNIMSEIFRRSGRMAIRVLFFHADNNAFDAVSNELPFSGIRPDLAVTGEEGLSLLQLHDLDVAVLEAATQWRGNGALLERIKWVSPLTEVIVSVTHDCTDLGIKAMKRGAYDHIVKPMEISELVAKIVNAKKRKSEQVVKIERAYIERKVMPREPRRRCLKG